MLGEAKRGKTSLVNALAGAELLPIGTLPRTSVATIVQIGAGQGTRTPTGSTGAGGTWHPARTRA